MSVFWAQQTLMPNYSLPYQWLVELIIASHLMFYISSGFASQIIYHFVSFNLLWVLTLKHHSLSYFPLLLWQSMSSRGSLWLFLLCSQHSRFIYLSYACVLGINVKFLYYSFRLEGFHVEIKMVLRSHHCSFVGYLETTTWEFLGIRFSE